MPVALPPLGAELLEPPDADEVLMLSRGVVSAVMPADGLSELQKVLIEALFEAMTGHPAALDAPPVGAEEFAMALARRNAVFRTRIVQNMVLAALVLRPLPRDVADRVAGFARALSVDDGMLSVAREFAAGSLGLAAADFEHNGYTATWSAADTAALHASTVLATPWDAAVHDEPLAAQWRELEALPAGTLGRRITEFYRARGFAYPGLPGSAPPLLAQHDWVHVLADYGTTVESELEVFAFIARANDDLHAFSLLAMVVSLFETGELSKAAGFFEASPGHLSTSGMPVRVADAMRRGALIPGSWMEPRQGSEPAPWSGAPGVGDVDPVGEHDAVGRAGAVVAVGDDVQGAPVVAAEHAGEAAAVGFDDVEHGAALGHARASLSG